MSEQAEETGQGGCIAHLEHLLKGRLSGLAESDRGTMGWAGAWGAALLATWALDIARALRPPGPRSAGTAASAGFGGHHQVLTGEFANDT